MLYNEFIEGTGCRDNEYNYKVYKDLEVMYMNSDLSKTEIYEYGKKLVDNSKPEHLTKLEKEIKEQIAEYRKEVKWYKEKNDTLKALLNVESDLYWITEWRRQMKYNRDQMRAYKQKIVELRWVLQA